MSAGAPGGGLHVGLFLANQQPVGADMVGGLAEQMGLVHLVRDAGWDSLWTGQHFLTDSSSQLHPLVIMARLAAEAGEMRLGLGLLLLPLLNPVEVAEAVASLDVVCGGRLVLGVGIGYRDAEYDAFGVSKADARARFTDNLRIVRALLAGEAVDADLPWCRLEGATASVRAVQSPMPVWIGGNADAAVRRAARLGDAWLVNPHTTLATVRRQLEMFREERRRAGLPPARDVPVLREVLCALRSEDAHRLADRYLGAKYRAYAAWGQDRVLPAGESFGGGFDQLADERFVVGDPDECLRQLEAWRATTGATHLIVRSHWAGMPVDVAATSLDLLSRQVVPELRRAAAAPPPDPRQEEHA